MVIYYVLDPKGRILFNGQSLNLALSICQMFDSTGIKTVLAVEKPQEVRL
jgi:hypothetical protein